MSNTKNQEVEEFRASLACHGAFETLFESLPDVIFFVKDREARLMMGNHGLLRLLGKQSLDAVIGKTGADFFPKGIADAFQADDEMVINKGVPVSERVELILEEDGGIAWFCTTKQPLYGHDGTIVGLKGITRNLRKADPRLNPLGKMIPVINAMRQQYREPVDLNKLAHICHLSPSQFRRRFKALLHMSPLQFILKLRIQHAAKLLKSTSRNVSEIASDCGFTESNYFSRQFRQQMGIPPSEYREKYT